MSDKVDYTRNAEFKIEGTRLHIVVELDRDKVRISQRGGRERISSVIVTLPDTPAGPVSANVSVRTLAAGEGREAQGRAA